MLLLTIDCTCSFNTVLPPSIKIDEMRIKWEFKKSKTAEQTETRARIQTKTSHKIFFLRKLRRFGERNELSLGMVIISIK